MAVNAERWASMTLAQQMSNIGSEVGRSAKWLSKDNLDLAEGAFLRAQELIDLTIKYGRKDTAGRNNLLRELCRAREIYLGAFLDSDFHCLSYLDRYFSQFAAICRRS